MPLAFHARFKQFVSNIDAIAIGRNTFGMWPYEKPVYVISSSLSELPKKYYGKAEILNLKPSQIIERLNNDAFKNLYIDGGVLIQSFLSEDLIDELIITYVPLLLGEGMSLFGTLEKSLKFKFQHSEILLGSLIKSRYIIDK